MRCFSNGLPLGLLRAFLFPTLILLAGDAAAAPRSVVYFIADDVGAEDLGCYGHPTLETPHIDRLAQNGLRFENAYLVTSSCSPSRCAIITGRYPHNTGASELHRDLPDSQVRFPELLKAAGYHTVLSGKNHMVPKNDRAFTKITRGGGPGSEGDWRELVAGRPMDAPFFFWFASSDAHRGWKVSDEVRTYESEEVVVPPYLIDNAGTRGDLALYYHEVSRYDHYVGEVVAELEVQGVLEETLIIVMADNGRPFPRCKTRLYDSGIKTPFVVHCPELVAAGGVSASLVSSIDVAATVLEVAGLEPAPTVQGQSFLPIMEDPKATVREVVFAEHNWHVYQAHERMVRWGDYLYIKNNYPERQNLCLEAFQDPAGEAIVAAHEAGTATEAQENIFRKPCPEEELFRVSADGHQLENLAANPEYSAQLERARALLSTWTEETADTVPENPTPDRGEAKEGEGRNPHREQPGEARGAEKVNAPGPLGV